MTDSILSAVLTFSLMIGGTAAIGSEMVSGHRAAAPAPTTTVTLAPVTITGHRAALVADMVTLPAVTITGHRNVSTQVALDTHDVGTRTE